MLILIIAISWLIVPLLLRGPVDVTGGTGALDMTNLRPFIITEGLVGAGLCIVVAVLRWGRVTGLSSPFDPAGLRLALWFLVPAAMIISMTWTGLLMTANSQTLRASLWSIATLSLLIGLFEELLFRGVILHGLRNRLTAGWAIIASGLNFGVFHAVNAIVGQDLTVTAIQMAGATGLGLFFGAITVQARSLWPAIGLHALWDAFALSMPVAVALSPQTSPADIPQPGLPALVMPTLLSLAAWIIYRRWCRRITRASSCQLGSN